MKHEEAEQQYWFVNFCDNKVAAANKWPQLDGHTTYADNYHQI